MKDFKIQLEAYTSNLIVWTILLITMALMIANILTIFNMMAVVETMWVEIEQVKETNEAAAKGSSSEDLASLSKILGK